MPVPFAWTTGVLTPTLVKSTAGFFVLILIANSYSNRRISIYLLKCESHVDQKAMVFFVQYGINQIIAVTILNGLFNAISGIYKLIA